MWSIMYRRGRLLLLTGAVALVAGCSDDTEPVDAAVDAGLDTYVDGPVVTGDGTADAPVVPGDGTPDATPSGLTFFVYTPGTAGDTPLDQARVALDLPDGSRVEKLTAADGKVTFSGIDWSAGNAAATANLDGYDMYSECNLNPTRIASMHPSFLKDGAVRLALYPLSGTAADSVKVSGTAKNLVTATQNLVVNVLRASLGSAWQGKGNQTFTVDVAKGEDFALQGIEVDVAQNLPSGLGYQTNIKRVVQKDFTALTQDSTGVELDFVADEVTTQAADITVGIPSRTDSPVRASYPKCLVCNGASTNCNGWTSLIEIVPASDELKASMVWTAPTWATDVQLYCYAYHLTTGDFSYFLEDGYPKAGAISTPMLDVPQWKTPATSGTPHPLYTKMEWDLFDTGVETLLDVYKEGALVWTVSLGVDATSVTLPKPPSSVDTTAFFGTKPLTIDIFAYVPSPAGTWFDVSRAAISQTRDVAP